MGAERTEITSGKWAGVGDIRYLKQYVPGECGKELMGAERTEITSGKWAGVGDIRYLK